MNEQKQRILIATACGWYDFGTTAPERGKLGFRVIGRNGENMDRRLIPDYTEDLNAMHEAEKVLTGYLRTEYTCALRRIIVRDMDVPANQNPDTSTLLDIYFYGATAAQRAEAFLRTLNLWKE